MNTLTHTSKAQDDIEGVHPVVKPIRTVLSGWGAVAVLMAALAFTGSSLITARDYHTSVSVMLAPVLLFAIGLAPMIGAALVIWTSRGSLAPTERRSQLIGASLSAVLFFPALLLARAFT